MAGDFQTERFGEAAANESRNRADSGGSPYIPVVSEAQPSGKGSGCGCWVFGCAGVLIGGLMLAAALGFGGYWYLKGQVEKYTDTEPEQIPVVEMEEQELIELQDRIERFSRQISPDDEASERGVEANEAPQADAEDEFALPAQLVLTANEINALIHANESLRGVANVAIENGRIQAKVSFPMDQVPGGEGRYFNADAEVEVFMQNGILVVKLVDATVKGESLPDAVMAPLREQNFARQAYDDVQTAEILRRFESIEVVDDAIVLRLRTEDDETPAERPPTSAEEAPAEAPLPFESSTP